MNFLSSHAHLIRMALHCGLRLRRSLKRKSTHAFAELGRRRALLWHSLYKIRYRCLYWQQKHGAVIAALLLGLLIVVSAYFIPALQNALEPYFTTEPQLASLGTLFVTVGGALIGAAAIVSSLVLFAMQVNIERMPHGLFRKLSVDRWLLSAFAATFLLAATIASLSLTITKHRSGVAVYAASWSTVLILVLFLYGYRRALSLVNPTQQLRHVVRHAERDLQAWGRRATRAEPLLSLQPGYAGSASPHDVARTTYFQANPRWTAGALQGVRYATSFARRYAEQGDHEVSAAAMDAVVAINSAYVQAKGRTFFSVQVMFTSPLTTDGFINDTLEHLRQTARIGVSRGDEQQIEQTLRAMAALAGVYLTIDYGSARQPKTHAHLAAGYLGVEVERILPHNMPDVLMEGVRLMGRCADMALVAEGPQGIIALVQKLGPIASAGIAREDYRPVTSTGVEQLARLSFNLLRTKSRDVRFAAQEIRNCMSIIAGLFMTVSDGPFLNIHSTYLGPYYSATSTQSLTANLTEFVNHVADAAPTDESAKRAIENFEQWADGIQDVEKKLLLRAIETRTHFTFDLIHWVTAVTSMLLAVSNAPACSVHTRGELRKHAHRLIAVLSWVPHDEQTVGFLENLHMTETFFEAAMDAERRGCSDLSAEIGKMLLSWMFSAGQFHTGWATLERSVYSLATLAIFSNNPARTLELKAMIAARLAAGGLPDTEVRDHAALEIRERAATLHREGHWSSAVENAMAQTDHQKLQPLLEEIADLLSPDTKGQAADHAFF